MSEKGEERPASKPTERSKPFAKLPMDIVPMISGFITTDNMFDTRQNLSNWAMSFRVAHATLNSDAFQKFNARTRTLITLNDDICSFLLGKNHSPITMDDKESKARVLYAAAGALPAFDENSKKHIISDIIKDYSEYKQQDEVNRSRDHYVIRGMLAAALIKSEPYHHAEHITQVEKLKSDQRESNTWSIGRDFNLNWSRNDHTDFSATKENDGANIDERIANLGKRFKESSDLNVNVAISGAAERAKIREVLSIVPEIGPLYIEARHALEHAEQRDVVADASKSRQALLNAVRPSDHSR
jgi:hypothetical protein